MQIPEGNGDFKAEIIQENSSLISCADTFSDILSISSRAHSADVPFFCVESAGQCGFIFSDVGDEFPY